MDPESEPEPENNQPAVDSKDRLQGLQPSLLHVFKSDITLDESSSDKKKPQLPPLFRGNPEPDINLDEDPTRETIVLSDGQSDDGTYPAGEPTKEESITPNSSQKASTLRRIRSVDALRGFDMFWIVGGNILLLQLAKLYEWPWLTWATSQLEHTDWAGFTFYDLIFPLFLFLAGVSMPISLGKKIEQGASKAALLRKVSIRAILLILLGIVYNGGLEFKTLSETRIFSVLGFIGVSYFIAALIFIYSDAKHRVMWALGLLGGYYAALMFIHVPGHGAGNLTPEGVFTGYIDRTWIPWKLYTPHFDPEGLFLPVAGAVVAIVGSLTGSFLVRSSLNEYLKAIILGAFGVAFYFAAQFMEPQMIIAKNFWSPTFVILCLGWSLMLLGAFYLIMDVIGFWQWAFFFIVIGMNSITIYMGLKLFNFTKTTNFLFGGAINKFFKVEYQPLLTSIAFILTWWAVLFFMYRKKIFLRV